SLASLLAILLHSVLSSSSYRHSPDLHSFPTRRSSDLLDLSHKDPKELDVKLGGIIEIYEKFVGEDPRKVPMKIFPAVHYSMGGLWVDDDQMTNIPGIFAAGECDYSQ